MSASPNQQSFAEAILSLQAHHDDDDNDAVGESDSDNDKNVVVDHPREPVVADAPSAGIAAAASSSLPGAEPSPPPPQQKDAEKQAPEGEQRGDDKIDAESGAVIIEQEEQPPPQRYRYLYFGDRAVVNVHDNSLFVFPGRLNMMRREKGQRSGAAEEKQDNNGDDDDDDGADDGGCLASVRRVTIHVVDHALFDAVIILGILMSLALYIVDTTVTGGSASELRGFVLWTEVGILSLFGVEMIAKVVALGFVAHPYSYCRDPLRALELLVVVTGVIAVPLVEFGQVDQAFKTMRNVKLIRLVHLFEKIMILVPQLRGIFDAFRGAAYKLVNLIFLYVIVAMCLALLGLRIFGGALDQRCFIDVDDSGRALPADSPLRFNVLDPRSPGLCSVAPDSNGGASCFPGAACGVNRSLYSEPYTDFDNIGNSLLVVFEITTVAGWRNEVQFALGQYAILFPLVIVFVCCFCIMSFFVAVLSMEFEIAAERHYEEEDAALFVSLLFSMHTSRLPDAFFLESSFFPESRLRFYSAVINTRGFRALSVAVTLVNLASLAVFADGLNDTGRDVLRYINVVCGAYFVLEALLRIFAFGAFYFTSLSNVFDFLLSVVNVVEFGVDGVRGVGSIFGALRALRVLSIFRLAILWERARQLLVTLSYAARISFVMFLLVVAYVCVSAIFAVYLFQGAIDGSTARPNFKDLPESILSMFLILTGENWIGTTRDVMVGAKTGAAAVFFVAYFFVGNYLLLNFFCVIAICSYERAAKQFAHAELNAKIQAMLDSGGGAGGDGQLDDEELDEELAASGFFHIAGERGAGNDAAADEDDAKLRRRMGAEDDESAGVQVPSGATATTSATTTAETAGGSGGAELSGDTAQPAPASPPALSESVKKQPLSPDEKARIRALAAGDIIVSSGSAAPSPDATVSAATAEPEPAAVPAESQPPLPLDVVAPAAAAPAAASAAATGNNNSTVKSVGSSFASFANLLGFGTKRGEPAATVAAATAAGPSSSSPNLHQTLNTTVSSTSVQRPPEQQQQEQQQPQQQQPASTGWFGLLGPSVTTLMAKVSQTASMAARAARDAVQTAAYTTLGRGSQPEMGRGSAVLGKSTANLAATASVPVPPKLQRRDGKRGGSSDDEEEKKHGGGDDADSGADDDLVSNNDEDRFNVSVANFGRFSLDDDDDDSTLAGTDATTTTNASTLDPMSNDTLMQILASNPNLGKMLEEQATMQLNIGGGNPANVDDALRKELEAKRRAIQRARKRRQQMELLRQQNAENLLLRRALGVWHKVARFIGVEYSAKDPVRVVRTGDCEPLCSWWCGAETLCGLRLLVARVVYHPVYDIFTFLAVLDALVSLGFSAEDVIRRTADPEYTRSVLFVNNAVITAWFAAEVLLKLFALSPRKFFREPWNVYDAVVVILTGVSLSPDVQWLTFARSLWVSRLAQLWHPQKRILTALGLALPGLTNVGILLFMTMLTFSILGVQLFAGQFGYCNDANITSRDLCNGTYASERNYLDGTSYIADSSNNNSSGTGNATELLQQKLANLTRDVAALPIVTEDVPREWRQYYFNFNNVGEGIKTCFVLLWSDGWSTPLFQALGSEATSVDDPGGARSRQAAVNLLAGWRPDAVVFFIAFMFIANFVMKNLFISAMLASFSAQRQRDLGYVDKYNRRLLTAEQEQWLRSYRFVRGLDLTLPPPPLPPSPNEAPFSLRRWCCAVYYADITRCTVRVAFEVAIAVAILIDIGFMASEFAEQPQWWTDTLFAVNLLFLSVYTIEALIALVASTPHRYARDPWNLFALALVLTGFVDAFDLGTQVANNVFSVVRCLRLLRVVRRLPGLYRIFETAVYAAPQIVNVTVTLFLCLYVFGTAAVALFQDLPIDRSNPDAVFNDFYNFRHSGFAMITLMQTSTTVAWASAMQTMQEDGGDAWYAVAFMLIFMAVAQIVFLNLFVFVMIDSIVEMDRSAHDVKSQWLLAQLRDLGAEWSRADPNGRLLLPWEQFVRVVERVVARERECARAVRADVGVPSRVIRGKSGELVVLPLMDAQSGEKHSQHVRELEMQELYANEAAAEARERRKQKRRQETAARRSQSHAPDGTASATASTAVPLTSIVVGGGDADKDDGADGAIGTERLTDRQRKLVLSVFSAFGAVDIDAALLEHKLLEEQQRSASDDEAVELQNRAREQAAAAAADRLLEQEQRRRDRVLFRRIRDMAVPVIPTPLGGVVSFHDAVYGVTRASAGDAAKRLTRRARALVLKVRSQQQQQQHADGISGSDIKDQAGADVSNLFKVHHAMAAQKIMLALRDRARQRKAREEAAAAAAAEEAEALRQQNGISDTSDNNVHEPFDGPAAEPTRAAPSRRPPPPPRPAPKPVTAAAAAEPPSSPLKPGPATAPPALSAPKQSASEAQGAAAAATSEPGTNININSDAPNGISESRPRASLWSALSSVVKAGAAAVAAKVSGTSAPAAAAAAAAAPAQQPEAGEPAASNRDVPAAPDDATQAQQPEVSEPAAASAPSKRDVPAAPDDTAAAASNKAPTAASATEAAASSAEPAPSQEAKEQQQPAPTADAEVSPFVTPSATAVAAAAAASAAGAPAATTGDATANADAKSPTADVSVVVRKPAAAAEGSSSGATLISILVLENEYAVFNGALLKFPTNVNTGGGGAVAPRLSMLSSHPGASAAPPPDALLLAAPAHVGAIGAAKPNIAASVTKRAKAIFNSSDASADDSAAARAFAEAFGAELVKRVEAQWMAAPGSKLELASLLTKL